MTTSPTTPGGRAYRAPAGEGDRLRVELLDAAEGLLQETGSIEKVSLRQVARRVGVSPTSVYLHFADKDELLLAVCQRRFGAFADLLQEAREGAGDPAAQLLACGRAYVRFGMDHPEHYKLLFGSLPMSVILERLLPEELVGLQALEAIAGIVAEGVAAGDFRDTDPFEAAVSLWALVHGLVGVLSHGHGKPVDADRQVDHALAMLLDGLRA